MKDGSRWTHMHEESNIKKVIIKINVTLFLK